jgi:hypothetical protein
MLHNLTNIGQRLRAQLYVALHKLVARPLPAGVPIPSTLDLVHHLVE